MAKTNLSLASKRSEQAFDDFKKTYDTPQALAEANRCLYCHNAPCTEACPTHIDVPAFIRKIGTGNMWGAARNIFAANVFGMSCARVCPVEVLCAGACVLHENEQPPIEIGKLQRYATDHAYTRDLHFFEAGANSGKSVGLIGSGPASLAAAHLLRQRGHACTVYEQRDLLGGLSTSGVAPYKLRADRALQEIDWVLGIGGIDVQTGVRAGVDVSWGALEEKHDALFIGLGLGDDQWLDLPGSTLKGIEGAVDFIARLKLGEVSLEGVRHAFVVGGGNTAVDVVRELIGLGVSEVSLVYRRAEARMPGYAHEWAAAKVKGARALWQHLPTGFEGDDRVRRIRLTRLDEQCQPVEGSEFSVDADLVLMAIGQKKIGDSLAGLDGVRLDGGRVVVDAFGATGRPGVFAGGDCVNGGKEVVNAVAEGAEAARAIDRYLQGGQA